MAIEIERKFIVDRSRIDLDKSQLFSRELEQGYLGTNPASSVRVRIETSTVTGKKEAFMTIKGASVGSVRSEYEYAIPASDAREMLDNLCRHKLVKTRWYVLHDRRTWHVDEFHGENAGLVTAEVELENQHDLVMIPAWAGPEVTGDHSYSNLALAMRPYRKY